MSHYACSSPGQSDAKVPATPFRWTIVLPVIGLCLYLPYAWIPPLVDNFTSTGWGEYVWTLAQFPGIMPNVYLTQNVLAGARQDAWPTNFLMIVVLWGLLSWLSRLQRRLFPIAAALLFAFSAFGAWALYQALLA